MNWSNHRKSDTHHVEITPRWFISSRLPVGANNLTVFENFSDAPCQNSLSQIFSNSHCVKSVQKRSYLWSVFSRIGTQYGEMQVSVCIQSKCGKRPRNNSISGHFSRSGSYMICVWWLLIQKNLFKRSFSSDIEHSRT